MQLAGNKGRDSEQRNSKYVFEVKARGSKLELSFIAPTLLQGSLESTVFPTVTEKKGAWLIYRQPWPQGLLHFRYRLALKTALQLVVLLKGH